MSNPPRPEHHLPVDLEDLADVLRVALGNPLGSDFAQFSRIYIALQRASLQDLLSDLRSCYRELDPDSGIQSMEAVSAEALAQRRIRLLDQTTELLRQANYQELTMADLQHALTKVSPRGLQVAVDLEEFEELGIHVRGLETRLDEQRDWRKLYLKKRTWETPVYRRLFLYLKLHASEDSEGEEQFLYFKLFRDVPQSDLEMLLPNTKVRMRFLDKFRIGVTGGGGTVGGVLAMITKVGAAANPMTWALALAGLAGVLWRQVSKVFTTRTRYMADLAQQLYFCNLDNNFGALVHLAEVAQLEESKEALLAYAFLAKHPDGLSREVLDAKVEAFLASKFQLEVDYEVDDGIAKLVKAGLLINAEGSLLQCIPPREAFRQLDRAWDDMFQAPLA